MRPIVLFEDARTPALGTLALCRAAHEINGGGATLGRMARSAANEVFAIVRPHLRILAGDSSAPESWRGDSVYRSPPATFRTPWLLVNSRLVPHANTLHRIVELSRDGHVRAYVQQGEVALAALAPSIGVPTTLADPVTGPEPTTWLAQQGVPLVLDESLEFYRHSHEVIRGLPQVLGDMLKARIAQAECREVADGVFVAAGSNWPTCIAADTQAGPIVIEAGVRWGAFCSLVGPLWIGPKARICDHAVLRGPLSIGVGAKVGGEIENSIVESYSNKGHFGYLGHSHVGNWVNLGAGTTGSNLKHTYGPIQADEGGVKTPSGMQFLGTIIGDFARTSIHCGLQAGKVLGVGACGYGAVMESVPPFVHAARQWGSMTAVDLPSVLRSVERMFSRRGVPFRPIDAELLTRVHALTEPARGGLTVGPPTFH